MLWESIPTVDVVEDHSVSPPVALPLSTVGATVGSTVGSTEEELKRLEKLAANLIDLTPTPTLVPTHIRKLKRRSAHVPLIAIGSDEGTNKVVQTMPDPI